MARPTEELIFDRTAEDVSANNNKGNYNYTDLNRIEKWCKYISELLNERGYINNIVTKTDWEVGFCRTNMNTEINRIRNNIILLRNLYYTYANTPTTPDISDNIIDYKKANLFEKILLEIDTLISNMDDSAIYCNTIYAGE